MTYKIESAELEYVEEIQNLSKLLLQELDGLRDVIKYRHNSPSWDLLESQFKENLEKMFARSHIMVGVSKPS